MSYCSHPRDNSSLDKPQNASNTLLDLSESSFNEDQESERRDTINSRKVKQLQSEIQNLEAEILQKLEAVK